MSSIVYVKEIAAVLADIRLPDPITDPKGSQIYARARDQAVDAVSKGVTPMVTSEDAGSGPTIQANLGRARDFLNQNSPDPAVAGVDQAETNKLNALRLSAWQTVANKIEDIIDEVQPDGQLSQSFVDTLEAAGITDWSTKP